MADVKVDRSVESGHETLMAEWKNLAVKQLQRKTVRPVGIFLNAPSKGPRFVDGSRVLVVREYSQTVQFLLLSCKYRSGKLVGEARLFWDLAQLPEIREKKYYRGPRHPMVLSNSLSKTALDLWSVSFDTDTEEEERKWPKILPYSRALGEVVERFTVGTEAVWDAEDDGPFFGQFPGIIVPVPRLQKQWNRW